VKGKQVRSKIGDHPAMSVKEARAAARKTLVAMRDGANPVQERRRAKAKGMTFKQALDLHLSGKVRSARTTEGYHYLADTYLSDWQDKPLVDLGEDRAAVRDRHRRLTTKHGKTTADYALRVFRAAYNRALRQHPELPPNPVTNVDFNGAKRRKIDASPERLLRWGTAVLHLPSPIRRDLHLFILLTGMRRTSAVEAKVKDLDLDAGVLHVPTPKGGAERAFDLPLSKPLVDLLRHRVAENPAYFRDSPFLFPSNSASGHVAEVQEKLLAPLTGHALRHVYSSLALEAGVPLAELRFLLNHSMSALGVTGSYLHLSLDHLRGYQEQASARILQAVGLDWSEGSWPPTMPKALAKAAE
jgi:integrase